MGILFKNKKNGNVYVKLEELSDSTNGREFVRMVLYVDQHNVRYVRTLGEFEEKFEPCTITPAPEVDLDRKAVLLRAAYDLLKKQENSRIALYLLSETVYYDGADCDGECLMEDIKNELGTRD
jgi:hypothetical protein